MNVLFEGKFAKDLLRQRQQSPDLLQSLQGVLIGISESSKKPLPEPRRNKGGKGRERQHG